MPTNTPQAWDTGKVDFKGEFYNITGIQMEFQPTQKPHPQVWIGGNGSQAITRAARFGDYWIPTDYTIDEYKQRIPHLAKTCKQFPRDSGHVKVASHLMVIVHKNRNDAESLAKNVADSLHTKLDELKEWAIVGDTKDAANRIDAYNAEGVDYHVLNFGTKVRDEAGIELFARDVLPSFT